MSESKRFTFYLDGNVYTAYVRYHEDGDCDVEIDGDGDFSPEAYEYAWDIADSQGLMDKDENGDYGDKG